MISSNRLQDCYVNLYICLREYIWDLEVVEIISELEIETYRVFPDTAKIGKWLSKLKREIRSDGVSNDDKLQDVIDEFESVLSNANDMYATLKSVN